MARATSPLRAQLFHAIDLIRTKRDGGELKNAQIDWLIAAYTADQIADEQMATLAMAVMFRGLSRRELQRWTRAMINSGERLDFSKLSRPTVDKHSTGGVGDKVSIVLAPLIASLGVAVPMMSGRGLGHTGGTLDKLESIPGFRVELTT
ncbi:MAG TPA: thymidine phosphorylase, partial [Propionibacteriaceae bacterium]|nr:thymidine phosphorylase [Propionibacteriaceae bacterium]